MEESRDINDIIIASLSGEATPDEMNQLKCWLQKSDKNLRDFEILRQFWNNSHTSFTIDNHEDVYNKLNLLIYQEAPVIPIKAKKRSPGLIAWASVAAVVLLTIVFNFLFIQKHQEVPVQISVEQIEKSNPAGRKSRIILPDSSLVWLNSESRISYYNTYGEAERVVWLDGEAYFEVKQNKDQIFKVITDDITTTALSTSFNINTYNNLIKVSLITGKVKIENSRGGIHESDLILNPGEEIVYDIQKAQLFKQKSDVNEALYWKDRIISFKRASFNEVIETLGRWYGVQFIIDEPMDKNWNFTGKFYNETLENVLLAISFARQFEFTINHQVVYLKPKI
jgi:transmembrane sensor